MKMLPLLLLLILNYNTSMASEIDSLKSIETYQTEDLQLIFVLINDKGFFEEWKKPEMPQINNIDTFKLGEEVIPIIIFGTNYKDENGFPNLTYDIKIIKPNGDIYGEYKQLSVWENAPAPVMHLVKQPIMIGLEEKDPIGIYKIEATVYDNIKNHKVDLLLIFRVIN